MRHQLRQLRLPCLRAGVAEFITWDRQLAGAELRAVQQTLVAKYGLQSEAPPAPPAPVTQQPQLPQLPATLSEGLLAWRARPPRPVPGTL